MPSRTISPELKLLFACGNLPLSASTRSALHAALLAEACSWPAFLDYADDLGFIPLLSRVFMTGGLPAPPEFTAELARRSAQKTMQTLGMVGELGRVFRLLESAGLTPVTFKGPLLSWLAYNDLALRDSTDLDIYIPRTQLHKALELLGGLGYRKKSEGFSPSLSGACEVALQRKSPDFEIDLHWQFSPPYFIQFDSERALQRSVVLAIQGLRARTLRSEDLLLYLCLHAARDCWGVRAVCDIGSLIRDQSLDWSDLLAEAERISARRVLATGLLLARHFLEVDLPSEVLRWCERDPNSAQIASEVALELTSGSPTSEVRRHLSMLETWLSKSRYLWRRAVQPNHLDADFFPLPEKLTSLYYGVRLLRIAGVAMVSRLKK